MSRQRGLPYWSATDRRFETLILNVYALTKSARGLKRPDYVASDMLPAQPLFFADPLSPLFSYLPANTLIVTLGDSETSARRFWQDAEARYESRHIDPMRPLLPPSQLWLRNDELFSELKHWPRVQLKAE